MVHSLSCLTRVWALPIVYFKLAQALINNNEKFMKPNKKMCKDDYVQDKRSLHFYTTGISMKTPTRK